MNFDLGIEEKCRRRVEGKTDGEKKEERRMLSRRDYGFSRVVLVVLAFCVFRLLLFFFLSHGLGLLIKRLSLQSEIIYKFNTAKNEETFLTPS